MFILLGAYPISVYLYINKIELLTSPDPHGNVWCCQWLNVGVIVAGFIGGGSHRPSLYVSSTPRYERDSNSQH
jgi:hypothetical protein